MSEKAWQWFIEPLDTHTNDSLGLELSEAQELDELRNVPTQMVTRTTSTAWLNIKKWLLFSAAKKIPISESRSIIVMVMGGLSSTGLLVQFANASTKNQHLPTPKIFQALGN